MRFLCCSTRCIRLGVKRNLSCSRLGIIGSFGSLVRAKHVRLLRRDSAERERERERWQKLLSLFVNRPSIGLGFHSLFEK